MGGSDLCCMGTNNYVVHKSEVDTHPWFLDNP